MLAHVFEREQALFLDCTDNRSLAHAVATAHFRGIRHGGGFRVSLMTDVARASRIRFAEHQRVANVADVSAFAQQIEIPAAVDRVAVQAGANQLVILQHQFLVDATDGIRQHDFLGAFAAHEFACRKQIDAGDFQLGRCDRSLVATDAEIGQMIGAHLRHLE